MSNSASPHLHLGIACGGTGGHFFPALAIAREWRNAGGTATFFVSGQHAQEHLRLAGEAGFAAEPVPSLRLPTAPLAAAAFPFRLLGAIRRTRAILRRHRPGLLLGMGSFATVPAGLAAASLRIPLALHEGNTKTGKANRLLARFARLLMASFPNQEEATRGPVAHTGFPLRDNLIAAAQAPQRPDAYLQLAGLDPERPTLLVFGGSQGARFLNDLLARTLPLLTPAECRRFQLLQFTGQEENSALLAACRHAGLAAHVKKMEADMAAAYQAASLVVCRAGAATICELALFAKPAILIPLPTAADDHQSANARCVLRHNGALLLPQATPDAASALATILREWLATPGLFTTFGRNLHAPAQPDAARRVVQELRNLLPAAGS
ncbi:MAG: glycosyltransferase [Lentisphaeria bacterium]